MTREEAIAELSVIHKRLSNPKDFEDGCYSLEDGYYVEALDMAIEALKDRPQGDWVVTEHCSNAYGFRKWTEIECPFCGERPVYEDIESMNYCPNCGAKMHKGGDDE